MPHVKRIRSTEGVRQFSLEKNGRMHFYSTPEICQQILDSLAQTIENNYESILDQYSELIFAFTKEAKSKIELENEVKISVVKLENLNKERTVTYGTPQAELPWSEQSYWYQSQHLSKGLLRHTCTAPSIGGGKMKQASFSEQKKVIIVTGRQENVRKAEQRLQEYFSPYVMKEIQNISPISIAMIAMKLGEIIKAAKCRVVISRNWGDNNKVTFRGLKQQVEHAKQLIEPILQQTKYHTINLRNISGVKAVIGKGGKNLTFLREKSKCGRIYIDIQNQLHMVGTQEQIDTATKLVLKLLRANEHIIGTSF